jgi:hypothetical protein
MSCGDGFLLVGKGNWLGSPTVLELAKPLVAPAGRGLLDEGRLPVDLLAPEQRAQVRQSDETHFLVFERVEDTGGSITDEKTGRWWRNGRKDWFRR